MVAKLTLAALLAASLAVASPVARDKGGNGKGKGQALGQLAKKNNGRYFGNAVEPSYFSIPQYNNILEQQFNCLSPENVMKWEVIHPEPNVYNFTGADAMFAKAKEMGAQVRGHNFVWHQQTPAWVTSITDKNELLQVLHDHIFTVIQRYGKQLQYFDVINERECRAPEVSWRLYPMLITHSPILQRSTTPRLLRSARTSGTTCSGRTTSPSRSRSPRRLPTAWAQTSSS